MFRKTMLFGTVLPTNKKSETNCNREPSRKICNELVNCWVSREAQSIDGANGISQEGILLFWLGPGCYGPEDVCGCGLAQSQHRDQPSLLNWSSGKEINKPRISKVGLLKAKKARLKRIIHFYESSAGKLILHV